MGKKRWCRPRHWGPRWASPTYPAARPLSRPPTDECCWGGGGIPPEVFLFLPFLVLLLLLVLGGPSGPTRRTQRRPCTNPRPPHRQCWPKTTCIWGGRRCCWHGWASYNHFTRFWSDGLDRCSRLPAESCPGNSGMFFNGFGPNLYSLSMLHESDKDWQFGPIIQPHFCEHNAIENSLFTTAVTNYNKHRIYSTSTVLLYHWVC